MFKSLDPTMRPDGRIPPARRWINKVKKVLTALAAAANKALDKPQRYG